MAKHNVFDKIDVQKQKDLLVQILTSEPPYKSIQFEYDWYIYFGHIEHLCVDAYCENCCGEKVFSADVTESFQLLHLSAYDHLCFLTALPSASSPSVQDSRRHFQSIHLPAESLVHPSKADKPPLKSAE